MTACVENYIFYKFFMLSVIYYFTRCMTGKTIHVCVLTHFLLCVFHFMLLACRPNFSEAVFATYKVEQAWCRDNTVMFIFRGYLFASGLDYLLCWQTFFLNISLSIEVSWRLPCFESLTMQRSWIIYHLIQSGQCYSVSLQLTYYFI
jgi:hypothetical protein